MGKSLKPATLNGQKKDGRSSVAEKHIEEQANSDLPAKMQSENSFARTLIKVEAPLLTAKRRTVNPAGTNSEEVAASSPANRRRQSASHRGASARKTELQTTVARRSEKAVIPPEPPSPASAPTPDGVAGELWRIATGDGSESARVSALRALADIFGMLRAQPQELPEAMSVLLDALSRGFSGDPAGQGGASDGAHPASAAAAIRSPLNGLPSSGTGLLPGAASDIASSSVDIGEDSPD